MPQVSPVWLAQQKAKYCRPTLVEAVTLVPTSFVDFCQWLGVHLHPAQVVLCKVAFDGVQPANLNADEQVLCERLFGTLKPIPALVRTVVAIVAGGRAGKTYLSSLRILHLALTHPCTTLAPGEFGEAVIICPTGKLAAQALRYCAGALHSRPELASLIQQESTESVTIHRQDGKTIIITVKAAARGGIGGRGFSLVAALMDEAAFLLNADYVVCDAEIYKALSPRIMPGGQLLVSSTPWAEDGLLYELFSLNFGSPQTSLAVHAPTTLLRPDEHTIGFVERERQLDPTNAEREFDAEFMRGGSTSFFDPPLIKACLRAVPIIGDGEYILGLDCAFRKDPTGGVILRSNGTTYEVVKTIEIKPPKGGRLKPSETIRKVLDEAAKFGCRELVADQHYIETVRENAPGWAVVEAPADPLDAYLATRNAMREGRLGINQDESRLVAQLKAVQQKPGSGGKLRVESPRKGGAHGDIASALVLAVWRAGGASSMFKRGQFKVVKEKALERTLAGQPFKLEPLATVRFWHFGDGVARGLKGSVLEDGYLLHSMVTFTGTPADLEAGFKATALQDNGVQQCTWQLATEADVQRIARLRVVAGQAGKVLTTVKSVKSKAEYASMPAQLVGANLLWLSPETNEWAQFLAGVETYNPQAADTSVVDALSGLCHELRRLKGSLLDPSDFADPPKKSPSHEFWYGPEDPEDDEDE